MSLFRNLSFILLFTVLFFAGCSSKNEYNPDDINKFYKDSSNGDIINTRAMHRATMRPYSVFGITYTPFVVNVGDDFTGIASWYGPDFHDKKTSNGEVYNMYALTAAHKTLPMNTMLRVDNLENGRSVIVRINDRGPFVRGRIVDLSNKAAHAIEMVGKGTAKVKITVLGYNGELENNNAPVDALPSSTQVASTEEPIGEKIEALEEELKPLDIKEEKVVSEGSSKSGFKPIPVAAPIKTTVKTPVALKETKSTTPSVGGGNFSLQVGAFSQSEGALKTRDDFQKKFSNKKVEAKKIFNNGKYLFKVFINGFASESQAQIFKEQNNLTSALIISN